MTVPSCTGGPTMDYNIVLGTAGWGVWHSPDAGKSWVRHRRPFPLNSRIQALAVLPGEPRGLAFVPRVSVHPDDPRIIWAGVEIDGVFRSRDGGDTWTKVVNGLHDLDVHDLALARTSPPRAYVATNGELFWSDDRGEKWTPIGVK